MEWIYSVHRLGAAAQGAGQPEAIDPTEIEDGEAEAENETYLEDDWEKPDWITIAHHPVRANRRGFRVGRSPL